MILNSETGLRTELTELSTTVPGYSLYYYYLQQFCNGENRTSERLVRTPQVTGYLVVYIIGKPALVRLWMGGGLVNLAVHFPEAQRVKEQQIVFTVHFFQVNCPPG